MKLLSIYRTILIAALAAIVLLASAAQADDVCKVQEISAKHLQTVLLRESPSKWFLRRDQIDFIVNIGGSRGEIIVRPFVKQAIEGPWTFGLYKGGRLLRAYQISHFGTCLIPNGSADLVALGSFDQIGLI